MAFNNENMENDKESVNYWVRLQYPNLPNENIVRLDIETVKPLPPDFFKALGILISEYQKEPPISSKEPLTLIQLPDGTTELVSPEQLKAMEVKAAESNLSQSWSIIKKL